MRECGGLQMPDYFLGLFYQARATVEIDHYYLFRCANYTY